MQVSEVMTREVEVISPDASLGKPHAKWMTSTLACCRCAMGRLVGIITDRDITVRATSIGDPDVTRVDDHDRGSLVVSRATMSKKSLAWARSNPSHAGDR